MIKKLILILLFPLQFLYARAQSGELPVKEWRSNSKTPFVLYLSGDGGINQFSQNLCNHIHQAGYSVTAINSKSYFWHKKTPEQTASDIARYLNKQFNSRQNQNLVLIGYSFGADVLPFIIHKLPAIIKGKLLTTVLISPSPTTDFEIHWTDIFGNPNKRSMNVVAEINKGGIQKLVTIFGEDENGFPLNKIKNQEFLNVVLPGGHHYDRDTKMLTRTILKYF